MMHSEPDTDTSFVAERVLWQGAKQGNQRKCLKSAFPKGKSQDVMGWYVGWMEYADWI